METNQHFLRTGGQPVSDRMRELLARAAQDHVYEQRSQGQVLDEVRQRLEGMEWLLREVRERELTGLTGQLDTVRGQVDTVRGQVADLSGRTPDWATGLAEHVTSHVASMGERMKPVAELPALWADVGVVAEQVEDGLGRIQTVLDAAREISEATRQASQRVTEMTKRLDKLQGSMEAASVRFNRLDKSLADLGHRNDRLEHSITGVATRVERSLGDMAERVEQGLDAVNGRVEGVGGRLDGLDGRLSGLTGKLEGIDGRFERVDDRLEDVAVRVDRLPAVLEIADLRRTLAELAARPVLDHDDRFDALEEHLAEAVNPLLDELRARPDRDEVEAALARVAEAAGGGAAEFARRFSAVHDEVRAGVEGLQEEVGRRVDGALGDFTARVELVSRRVESVHADVAERVERQVGKQVEKQVEAVRDEVARQVGGVREDVSRRLGDAQHDLARQVGGLVETVTRQVGGVQDEVAKRVDGVQDEVARRTEAVQAEVGRRFGDVQDEVGRRVEAIHGDVAKQVTAVHEDVLKRLSTLEETMLALAEALLRPRRDGKEPARD